MFARHWLVCDMDGTITPTPTKAGGEYLSLRHSPCYNPIRRFLANGGNLCVVSTAGRRMWRQIFNEVSDVLFSPATVKALPTPGRLAICGFSGAALFLSDSETKSMKEVLPYRQTALKYFSPEHESKRLAAATTIDACHQEAIIDLAVDRVRMFINAAADEMLRAEKEGIDVSDDAGEGKAYVTPLVKMLSTKYHGPYMDLVRSRNEYLTKAESKSQASPTAASTPFEELLKDFYEEVLNKKRLTTHGSFITKTNDALVDLQTIPDTNPPVGIQVTVMGIPMRLFDSYFSPSIVAKLSEYGVFAKAQPNSVAIARKGIDKALCVQWLRDHVPDFSLERALAFGDIPVSVDKPLTLFPPMQFVSLSTTPSTDPEIPNNNGVFVGHEEEGTAAFLEAMLNDVLGDTVPSNLHDSNGDEGKGDERRTAESKDAVNTLFTPTRVGRWASETSKHLKTSSN